MTTTASLPTSRTPRGILDRDVRWTTLGACALVFLGAFEALAVATVMPVVSADLDGERLYALAFAGTLAASIVGMVVAGNWADRHGPRAPLYVAVAVFTAGLLISGLAPTMVLFVIGRVVQGIGGGALTVALYVLVAQVYPKALHPAIFAAFAAAWVIPSLVGPAIAGLITEVWSWHWVFLGVVGVVAIALLMVIPTLRNLSPVGAASVPRWAPGRIGWAIVAGAAVLSVSVLPEAGAIGPYLVPIAGVLAIIAVRPLLPSGTLRARRGLPAVILVRALLSAAYFGAQIYVPLLLVQRHEFSATLAGLTLTVAGLAWSVSSTVQGRLGERLSSVRAVGLGATMVLAGAVASGTFVWLELPAAASMAAWVIAGAGMGLASPRLSALTLSHSDPGSQGFNSAAMTIADAFGGALALAVTGIVFAVAGAQSFLCVFVVAAVIAAGAVVLTPRMRAMP